MIVEGWQTVMDDLEGRGVLRNATMTFNSRMSKNVLASKKKMEKKFINI